MPGEMRLQEAQEGITDLRAELAQWTADVDRRSRAGTHKTRLDALRSVLDTTLASIEDLMGQEETKAAQPLSTMDVYQIGRRTDKRVLFCRRLLGWYGGRIDQRQSEHLGACLRSADEVLWSVWKRTFDSAAADRPPPPLCFIDNDPIPSASLHTLLPHEATPPSMDPFFKDRILALPIPTITLPPIVTRRPWWLIVVIHEAGHHVQQILDPGAVVTGASVADAVRKAGATPAQQKQWRDWSQELFADAFAIGFGGAESIWAVTELERAGPDLECARPTYPPARWRLLFLESVLNEMGEAASGWTLDDAGWVADGDVMTQTNAVAVALLDQPLGQTTLRALAGGVGVRRRAAGLWRDSLAAGTARPGKEIHSATDCVRGLVGAWTADPTQDPRVLGLSGMAVLPGCGPDGTRSAAHEDTNAEFAAASLTGALTDAEDL